MPEWHEVNHGEDAKQAEWLADAFERRVRYDHVAKRWHVWNGILWAPDKTKEVQRQALDLVKERLHALVESDLGDKEREKAEKVYRRLLERGRLENALDVLTWHPDYKTDGADWDQDPYLLGCENGIVDLRTGQLVKNPGPELLVTRTTGINFRPELDPNVHAKRFMSFLAEITSNDGELAMFYLRWFAYSLFGLTTEQKFLILTGLGRNGKGALVTVMRHVFGEYSAAADQNLYMRHRWGSARSDGARADLMELKGKRLAAMSEPDGGAFNEEMLKAHTGGDPITARTLHSALMLTWTPTHTITFLTNNPPTVQDIGPAMASRVMVADFRERFEGAREDKKLYERLKEESEGILSILVRLAVQWYESERGLELPERVLRASAEYLTSNDPIGRALDEAFVFDKAATSGARKLYDAYTDWFARSDIEGDALTLTAFGLLLTRRGFKKTNTRSGVVYTGIRARSAAELADDET